MQDFSTKESRMGAKSNKQHVEIRTVDLFVVLAAGILIGVCWAAIR